MRPATIWLTLERNMDCGVGICGHCQLGQFFVCRDGPVFSLAELGTHSAGRAFDDQPTLDDARTTVAARVRAAAPAHRRGQVRLV